MKLNDYAIIAMNQAREASESGTFGVGGILIDLNGNIICKSQSRVINGHRINDPTAHVERQIIDWYFVNKEKLKLPEPENCIMITTLDPCVMCTGALAQVQFNRVIAVAPDKFAGINWKGNDECSALDGTELRTYVKEHYAYPEITGRLSRKRFGSNLANLNVFSDNTITSETLENCLNAYILTSYNIRNKVSSFMVDPSELKNPAELELTHPIRKYLNKSFGSDFLACSWKSDQSIESFIKYLQRVHPNFNGVSYFDMFGNLIYLDEDDVSIPTQSAFMKVTRKIAAVRNTEPIEGFEINDYLSSPRYGYFVYMNCPKISAKTVMELGAIGSTLENVSEHPIMYIYGEENQTAVDALIKNLPPLYNDIINIRFQQIPIDV